jgi:hypothetical protein
LPGNNDKKQVLAFLFAIIGIVILIISFIMPWWWVSVESESESIDGSTSTISKSDGFVSLSWGTSLSGSGARAINGDSHTQILIGITAMFIILALIFYSIMIAVILLNWLEKLTDLKLTKILGIWAMIFCLLAAIVFMVALPSALKADAEKKAEDEGYKYLEPDHDDPTKSFFGSYEGTDENYYYTIKTKQSWGGDIGWILAIISSLILLVSIIMLHIKSTKFGPSQPFPPQQYTSRPPPPPPRQQPREHKSYDQEEVSWEDY